MKHTCCNAKDSRGRMIHVGDEIISIRGGVIKHGETAFVHDTSDFTISGKIRIRVSDNQTEKEVGDFLWSAWVLPCDVRVIESYRDGGEQQ